MDFIEGGDFYQLLGKRKRLSVDEARFYIAGISLALNYLHNKRIVYRDLKPENILLGADGYAVLADFGLAKDLEENSVANSFCGTPEYLSPEMIEGTGHDYTLDWWTLGVFLYELLIGIPPFIDKN